MFSLATALAQLWLCLLTMSEIGSLLLNLTFQLTLLLNHQSNIIAIANRFIWTQMILICFIVLILRQTLNFVTLEHT